MGHIELARWADLILVAPASADVLARLAGGSPMTSPRLLWLAAPGLQAVAPAMNRQMGRAAHESIISVFYGHGAWRSWDPPPAASLRRCR